MLLDERHHLATEGVGGVVDLIDRRRAPQNRIVRITDGIQVVVSAAEEPEVLIEASPQGMELWFIAQVPLAKHARGIARLVEAIRQRRFLQRQAKGHRRVLRWTGIEFVSISGG